MLRQRFPCRRMLARHLALITLTVMAVGCKDSVPSGPLFAAPPYTLDAALAAAPRGELHLARLAATVPSFGGIALDSSGNVIVQVTNLGDGNLALRAAESLLAERQLSSSTGAVLKPLIYVKQSAYTYRELNGWRAKLDTALITLPEIRFVDLDERVNRIVISLWSDHARAAVEYHASTHGVPPAAISIELAPPGLTSELAQGATSSYCPPEAGNSLRSCHRPAEGGMQVIWPKNTEPVTYSACTIGFNARLSDGRDVLVTASHCGKYKFELRSSDLDAYYQAQIYDPSLPFSDMPLAIEAIDPAWVPVKYSFGQWYYWRYSDALAARTFAPYFRKIARPLTGQSLTIDAQNPRFNISGTDEPLLGESISKVGRTTGWTQGTVTRTCISYKYPQLTNRTLMCQHAAVMAFELGDSGGPVFRYGLPDPNPPFETQVTLLGTSAIRESVNGTTSNIFSPFSGIVTDIGQLNLNP